MDIEKRQGARLPHWTRPHGTYAVTFRLFDSIPKPAAESLNREMEMYERMLSANGTLSADQRLRIHRLRMYKSGRLLAAGMGECLMKDPDVARVVADALGFFDGKRYEIVAWCVMPNHVHALLYVMEGFQLSAIMHSWKSFTATRINKLLDRIGPVWQPEYFDHLIRDAKDLRRQVAYIRNNPTKAGLKDWPWVG